MSATGLLSWIKQRSRTPKAARRRSPVRLGGLNDWLLEDRCLLSAGPTLPTDTPGVTKLDQVMYNGVTGTDQKTLTITNDSSQTIYPFLRGQNSNQGVAPYQGTGEYDPYDPSTQDYRGYVGYHDATGDHAGVAPHTSITFTVPMVFWDSGRLFFTTDGTDLLSTYNGSAGGSPAGSPFYFFSTNVQAQYFLQTQNGDLTKLYFTPAYNTFGPDGLPSKLQWHSPVATGKLAPGKYSLAGPNVPANDFVTVDSANSDYVSLGQPLTAAQTTPGLYILNASPYPATVPTPTDHFIQRNFALTTQGSPGTTDGVVMWYHAQGSLNPNEDAPFQLTEITFRSNLYNTKGFQALMTPAAFDDAKDDAINYDISMVDSINMPVAMEASNATINYTTTQAPYGWIGSGKSLDPAAADSFQNALADFTRTNPAGSNVNGLGTYFGGRGYPSYVSIDPGNVKLPGGFNLFDVSPAGPNGLADVNYYKTFTDNSVIGSQRQYTLTSAGTGPITLAFQGAQGSQGHDLMLSTSTQAYQYALNSLVKPNVDNGFTYAVTYGPGTSLGTVTGLIKNGTNVVGVQVSGTVPADAGTQVFTLALPGTDYATAAIEKLWYSWAMYYVNNASQLHPVPPQGVVNGTVTSGNLLTLRDPGLVKGLVPGMEVRSPDDPSLTCYILSIDQGGQIHLSQTVAVNLARFTITNPTLASIAGYSPGMPLYTFNFPAGQPQADALAFAQTVYTVMGAFSHTTAGSANPAFTLLEHVIGGLFGGFYPNGNPDTTGILTNMSKSALRGVPDFTSPRYSSPSLWYPDPALATGGQTFNVYNLDPYIWFIHAKLVGATSYAFALDDDTSDVESKGATNLDISVGGLAGGGGLTGVPNTDPYSPVSPWGVVTTSNATVSPKASLVANLANTQAVGQILQYDYNNHNAGTLVNGPGVTMGTTVQVLSVVQNPLSQSTLILSNPLGSFAPISTPFIFFGPFTFTGRVLGKGQDPTTIILDSPQAFDTLSKLAADKSEFANIQVTGEGIAPATTVTIHDVIHDAMTGQYIVQLSSALVSGLVSQPGGSYAYTFGSPVVSPVSDFGFEFPVVQGLTGEFLSGTVLNPPGVTGNDWTFADFSASQLAGIAFDQGGSDPKSTYTNGNGPAPQGLQVGFIQGPSSITSSPKSLVTLTPGTYTLTFFAAQSAPFFNANDLQSLNVLLLPGNNLTQGGIAISKAPVTPPGVDWASQPYSIQFTVGVNAGDVAPGKYGIRFQGTATSSSTVLIDNVVLSQSATLGGPPVVGGPPPTNNEPPSGSPPESGNSPSSVGTHSRRSLSGLPKLERMVRNELALAQDVFWLTIEQMIRLAELALGMVPPAALANAIAAEQNAINADPASHTLLGHAVTGLTEFETLQGLPEALTHFGPGPG
jgi:hypothetical protein